LGEAAGLGDLRRPLSTDLAAIHVREFHRIREHGQELAGIARVVVFRVRSEKVDDGQSVSGVERGVAGRVY